jgi:hypothetical protein
MSDSTLALLTAPELLKRLDSIEAELKMVKNQVAHNLLSLKSIENRVTRLEDDVISSDPTYI